MEPVCSASKDPGSKRSGLCTLAALIFLVAVSSPVWADGSGTLVYHGQTMQLKFAYAFRHPYLLDRSEQATTFALTDKPFDTAKLDDSPRRDSELDHQLDQSGMNSVKVVLAPEGGDSIIQWQVAGHRRGTALNAYELNLKQNDDKRIVGTLHSKRDSDGGESFPDNPRLDLHFTIAVPGVPNLGTQLPADGGEPGKAYLAYNSALWKGDLDALGKADKKTLIWIEKRRNDENFRRVFSLLQSMQALRDLRIDKGFINGDKATLIVSGMDTGGDHCESTVTMSKEDGKWGIELITPHHSH